MQHNDNDVSHAHDVTRDKLNDINIDEIHSMNELSKMLTCLSDAYDHCVAIDYFFAIAMIDDDSFVYLTNSRTFCETNNVKHDDDNAYYDRYDTHKLTYRMLIECLIVECDTAINDATRERDIMSSRLK